MMLTLGMYGEGDFYTLKGVVEELFENLGLEGKKVKYGVDNKKCASILDTFSCTVQGLIPYGAQILIAAGLASVNPVSILPYLYYPFTLGLVAILSILLRYPKRFS